MPKRIIKALKHAKTKANKESVGYFLKENKAILLKLAVIAFVILLVYSGYCVYQTSQAKKFSAIIHESIVAQQNGDLKTAKEKLKSIYDTKLAPANVRAIASIRYAGFLLEEGNKAEAGDIYYEISECFSCNDYVTDLAGLLAVSTWLSDAEISKNDLSKKIKNIFDSSHSLKWFIAEQRGFYEMHKKNYLVANQIFEEIIKSNDADKTVKSRAQDAKKILVQKGFKVNEKNDTQQDKSSTTDKPSTAKDSEALDKTNQKK